MTAMTASNWTLTPGRVDFMTNVFKERVAKNDPNAARLWENIKVIGSEAGFKSMIAALKERPRVDLKPVAPVVAPVLDLAKEDGLYRNPADGTLYRLSTPKAPNAWTHPSTVVSSYSNKAVYRRLTEEGRMVKKGKWTRFNAQASRQMLTNSRWDRPGQVKVLAAWFLSEEEKTEWAVGICLCCYRGLIDAVSVYNSIGPVCAANLGVALVTPPSA